MQKAKLIRISIEQDETLFFANSPDIRNFSVSSRSQAETLAKCPAAIKEMLDFVGGNWVVTECENPEAIGAEHAFAALPAEGLVKVGDLMSRAADKVDEWDYKLIGEANELAIIEMAKLRGEIR